MGEDSTYYMKLEKGSLWLVGAGSMSVEYARVLEALGVNYTVVGRGDRSAVSFKENTGKVVRTGGLLSALENGDTPETAIVAVSVDQLANIAGLLIDAGTRHILLEKPGGINSREIRGLRSHAEKRGTIVMIAYNRRFYASTLKARDLIRLDGGVTSCNFEFTEWSHLIRDLEKTQIIKKSWFLANSTHVSDLAFFLSGIPVEWSSWHDGSLDWHPSAARFSGAGKTDSGALFSYQANWEAPGRWGLEVCTRKRRLILRPMEKLKETPIGSVEMIEVDIDDSLDKEFKPGIYRQTQAFLKGEYGSFCNLALQNNMFGIYEKMAGYAT